MRLHRTLLNSLGLMTLATLCGCSDRAPTDDPEAAILEPQVHAAPVTLEGEQLLAQPPLGWQQVFATKAPSLRIAEFIPADERIEDWQEKVTFESLGGDQLPDPIEFVTGLGADQTKACEQATHLNIQSGFENNYPTSVRLLTCNGNKKTGKDHVTLVKAIKANQHFYIITRTRRVPPPDDDARPISDEEMAEWATYLRALTVCDSNREQHPCPFGKVEVGKVD